MNERRDANSEPSKEFDQTEEDRDSRPIRGVPGLDEDDSPAQPPTVPPSDGINPGTKPPKPRD